MDIKVITELVTDFAKLKDDESIGLIELKRSAIDRIEASGIKQRDKLFYYLVFKRVGKILGDSDVFRVDRDAVAKLNELRFFIQIFEDYINEQVTWQESVNKAERLVVMESSAGKYAFDFGKLTEYNRYFVEYFRGNVG